MRTRPNNPGITTKKIYSMIKAAPPRLAALEVLPNLREVHIQVTQYYQDALSQFQAGHRSRALRILEEAHRIHSRTAPISYERALCYKAIAEIYNTADDERDPAQARHFYKQALNMLTLLNTEDAFHQAVSVQHHIGLLYFERGIRVYKIGTPYDYEFCLLPNNSEKMKRLLLNPETVYFVQYRSKLQYRVLDPHGKKVKGTITGLSLPSPLTIDFLNSIKKEILEFTSAKGHTRYYTGEDAEFSIKMRAKSQEYHRAAIAAYTVRYGILSPHIANSLGEVGRLYQAMHQTALATYFLKHECWLNKLEKMLKVIHPHSYNAILFSHKHKTTLTGIPLDASIVNMFIEYNSKSSAHAAICCQRFSQLYDLMTFHKIADYFRERAAFHTLMAAEEKNRFSPMTHQLTDIIKQDVKETDYFPPPPVEEKSPVLPIFSLLSNTHTSMLHRPPINFNMSDRTTAALPSMSCMTFLPTTHAKPAETVITHKDNAVRLTR